MSNYSTDRHDGGILLLYLWRRNFLYNFSIPVFKILGHHVLKILAQPVFQILAHPAFKILAHAVFEM